MSKTDVQRRIKRMRASLAVNGLLVALNAFVLALDLASGSALPFFPAVLIAVLLVPFVMQARLIGSVRRTAELNRHAGRLELAARLVADGTVAGTGTTAGLELGFARLGAALGPCSHPDAEPVDLLLTGERVAWVCPECNAELPAGWTPPVSVQGTLTASGSVQAAGTAALSGSGTLTSVPAGECRCCGDDVASVQVRVPESAEPLRSYCLECGLQVRQRIREERAGVVPGEAIRARAYREARAAEHLEQLAKVGLESCISDCPLCAERWIEEERWGGE